MLKELSFNCLKLFLMSFQLISLPSISVTFMGLGGYPFNPRVLSVIVTAEDVVYVLNGLGVKTIVDLRKLTSAAFWRFYL
ncbi:hypothetical protein SLEP1_g52328 [Rubroshorea leprosula]|uniref:Uncharacterized protein n=1 Tax=Rubroshorea leprosula TaxID=152421 RepID=A0AAV5M5Y5_9ROSI|nr:hypothetical protein SLEP1_g52328 [Rubroshorea leprosula]